MTNKDNIHVAHLEAIKMWGERNEDGKFMTENRISTSCTTITAEAIGEAMEWAASHEREYDNKTKRWHSEHFDDSITTEDMKELFLNQKAKI